MMKKTRNLAEKDWTTIERVKQRMIEKQQREQGNDLFTQLEQKHKGSEKDKTDHTGQVRTFKLDLKPREKEWEIMMGKVH